MEFLFSNYLSKFKFYYHILTHLSHSLATLNFLPFPKPIRNFHHSILFPFPGWFILFFAWQTCTYHPLNPRSNIFSAVRLFQIPLSLHFFPQNFVHPSTVTLIWSNSLFFNTLTHIVCCFFRSRIVSCSFPQLLTHRELYMADFLNEQTNDE